MKRIAFFLFIFLFTLRGYSQVILLNGSYQGKNIYIQNPYSRIKNNCVGYCTDKVIVNGKEIAFENADAYEIKLDSLDLKIGDSINVQIFHKPDCKPKILADCIDCGMKSTFELVSISIDSNAVLHWISKGESGKLPFTIEQFRWNKWMKVGEVAAKGGVKENEYSFQTVPHSGKNQFRIKQEGMGRCELSKTVDYISEKELRAMPCKLKNGIEFDAETDYEIYDSGGNIIAKGRSREISFNELKAGTYYLNYDNKTGEFIVHKNKNGKKFLWKN